MNGYLQNGDYPMGTMDGSKSQDADNSRMMGGQDMMGGGMVGGQSLDEIVNQNANAIRRQSMPRQYGGQQTNADTDARRISMMDYAGNSPAGPIGNFQYQPSPRVDQRGTMSGNVTPAQSQQQRNNSGHQTNADLSLQTSFADAPQGFNPMMNPTSAYHSSAYPQSGYDMSMNSPYIDTSMGMQMDFNVDQGLGNGSPADPQRMNMFNSQRQYSQSMMQTSPMHYGGSQTPISTRTQPQDPGGVGSRSNSYHQSNRPANAAQARSRRQSMQNSTQNSPIHGGMSPTGQPASSGPSSQAMQGFSTQMPHSTRAPTQDQELGNAQVQIFDGLNGPVPVNPANWNPNNQRLDWETPEGGWPSTLTGRPHMQTTYKNAYSSTGFDMLGVLVCDIWRCGASSA